MKIMGGGRGRGCERRDICERKDTGLQRWDICSAAEIYFR